MNNPNIIRFAKTLEQANDYGYSPDVSIQNRVYLHLKPNEVYGFYINTNLGQNETLQFISVSVIGQNNSYSDFTDINNNAYFNVVLSEDTGSECNYFEVKIFYSDTNGNINDKTLFSNYFTCNNYGHERTSLVTWWHEDNHYGIPYVNGENEIKPNQLRLPIYFKETTTSEESEEYVTTNANYNNVIRSRVERVFKKNWIVDGNEHLQDRVAIISDSDYIYINGTRQISEPFEPESTDGNKDFSISEWATQPQEGDIIDTMLGIVILKAENESFSVEYDSSLGTSNGVTTTLYNGYNHILNIQRENTSIVIQQLPQGILSIGGGQLILGSTIPATDFIYSGGISFTPIGAGNYQTEFIYTIIDELGNESEMIVVTYNAIDTNEALRQYDSSFYDENQYE